MATKTVAPSVCQWDIQQVALLVALLAISTVATMAVPKAGVLAASMADAMVWSWAAL